MTHTLKQMVHLVGYEIGRAGVDIDVQGEVAVQIQGSIERAHAELFQRRAICHPIDEVPDYAVNALVRYYANEARRLLDRTWPRADYEAERIMSLRHVREVTTEEPPAPLPDPLNPAPAPTQQQTADYEFQRVKRAIRHI